MSFPLTVAPGGTATIGVVFTPGTAGSRTGTLSIASNAPGSPATVALSGTATAAVASPLLQLHTSGGDIVDSNNAVVVLNGVNWHGAEGTNAVPHILWQRSYADVLDQVAAMGFNCLRIPLSADLTPSTPTQSINTFVNADLANLTAMQVLAKIITYAGTKGIRVFLDCHRLTAGAGTDSAISSTTLPAIQSFWQLMATTFGGNPNVIGCDLYNEPYTQTWAALAGFYSTLGNAVHAIAPHWLIICEGTGIFNSVSYWWGGQLAGAAATPVALTVANKLVYSPHDYGQGVSQQTWLKSTSNNPVGWPGNLDAIWDAAWGYLVKGNIAPCLVGEYGGKLGYTGTGAADSGQVDGIYEREWISHLCGYMKANGVSSTFWTLTPQSGDTGGLLQDDNATPQAGKLALIAPLLA